MLPRLIYAKHSISAAGIFFNVSTTNDIRDKSKAVVDSWGLYANMPIQEAT